MRILLSNDDGVMAPGIQTLAVALREFAQVQVVAPNRNRSASSNSLTLESPLRIETLTNGDISVIDGTPTDCVYLGVNELMLPAPEIVVSGINAGPNLGDDVIYSGTVAAATEGYLLGVPALAVSLVGKEGRHFETAGKVARLLSEKLITRPVGQPVLLNVNVPDLPFEQLAGMRVTRLGKRHKAEPVIRATNPRGETVYWVGPAGAAQDAGPGTDFHAIAEGYVSITPLRLDLTHTDQLDAIRGWLG